MSILEHHFPPLIAEKYGVNAAIFLRDIYHWCSTNRDNEQYLHKGRWWTYQTIKALCRRHPYWTKNQVEHIIKTCQEKGALLSGHFSEDPFDRTCWYSLTDEAWALFEGPFSSSDISEMDSNKITIGSRKNQKCNKDKHRTEDITEKKLTKKSPEKLDDQTAQILFNRFWAAYPKKKGKQDAMKAWAKLNPDMALCREMSAALKWQKQSEQWTRDGGQYIPHPGKWLRQRLWEDEPDKPSGGSDPYKDEGEDGI